MPTVTIDPNIPPNTGESPGLGAQRIREVKQAILDLFGLSAGLGIAAPLTMTRVGPLINRSGSALVSGDMVTIDPGNDSSIVLDDTSASPRPYLVTLAALASGDPAVFGQAGEYSVHTFAAVTRGHYLRKSATGGALEDTGIAQPNPPPAGSLGVAMTATASVGNSSVVALLFGVTIPQAAAVNAASYGFGPTASASTNRAALQAAIDALPAAGGLLQITTYGNHIDAVINVTKPLRIMGPGTTELSTPGTFVLYLDTASQVGFNVTGKGPLVMEDLSILGAAGTTHVVLNGPTGTLKGTESCYFSNVIFSAGAIQLDVQAAIFWHATNCRFNSYTVAGVKVQNTLDNDQGDSLIDGNCIFNGVTGGGAAGVLYLNGGGLKITDSKFLFGDYSVKVDRIGSILVTDLLIEDCSLESATVAAVRITRSAGNLALDHLKIADNQISLTPIGIDIEPGAGAGDLAVGAVISNNLISGGVTTAYKLRNVNVLMTIGNTVAATTVWNVDSTVQNVRSGPDYPFNFTTFLTGTAGTDYVLIDFKLTVAQLPAGLSDGSRGFASDAKRPGEGGYVAGGVVAAGGTGAPVYFAAGSWRA